MTESNGREESINAQWSDCDSDDSNNYITSFHEEANNFVLVGYAHNSSFARVHVVKEGKYDSENESMSGDDRQNDQSYREQDDQSYLGASRIRRKGGGRWIHDPNRCVDEYLDEIEDFIEFARRHNPGATKIRCLCRRCNNTLWETIENVGFHLIRNGIIETYSIWNLHGEQLDHASSSNATRVDNVEPIMDPNDQVMDIMQDAFPFALTNINQEGEDDVPTPIHSAEFEQYEKLLKKCQPKVIPGL
ncbi:unnamed protein product [Prunus armeniaca]